MTPQIILTLTPQGKLCAEIPLGPIRSKLNLTLGSQYKEAIGNVLKTLKDISKIKVDTESLDDIEKAKEIYDKLTNKIQAVTEAANALSFIVSEENLLSNIFLRVLHAQLNNSSKVGEDGNPTQHQIRHWEKHGFLCENKNCPTYIKGIVHSHSFSDPSCPICKGEGRFEPGHNRERSIKGLSEIEALRLGLISRGYQEIKPKIETSKFDPITGKIKEPTTRPSVWTKLNMGNIFLFPSGKIENSKKEQWLPSHKLALIQDGKIHALNTNFEPQISKPKRIGKGASVKSLVKMVKTTQGDRLRARLGNISF